MAKQTLPQPLLLCVSTLFLLSFNSADGPLKMANAQAYTQNSWCIANPMVENSALTANLDYACGHVDCRMIKQGGSCFYPNTPLHHASFAINLYYQTMGRDMSNCDFGGSGLISLTDPSHGSCTFPSGGPPVQTNNTSTSEHTWCVAKPGTSDDILQQNLDFACNHIDCSLVDDGGPCFNPTTLMNHASFAMNLYYQRIGPQNATSCDFRSTGLVVTNDPSYGACVYESG
ncbi:hypothetical protein ACFE04_015217 [Oxalis oulophora]